MERWRLGDDRPEIVAATLTWRPDPALAPFEVDLATFFQDVLGEP